MQALILASCGKAAFSGRTAPSAPTNIPIAVANTDVFVELGQEFSEEMTGGVEIDYLQMFATAQWPGANPLEFEMRTTLSGHAGVDQIAILGNTAPDAWVTGTTVFNRSVTGSNSLTDMSSSNLNAALTPIVAQKRFWIVVRLKYAGFDLPNTLILSGVHAYAEGQKSLRAASPLLNLLY